MVEVTMQPGALKGAVGRPMKPHCGSLVITKYCIDICEVLDTVQ